jgi:hypothetical protein
MTDLLRSRKINPNTKKIVIVSDGTGQTAKRLLDAVLAQYEDHRHHFEIENIYQKVRTKRKAKDVLAVVKPDTLVVFSLIRDDLRSYFHESLHERDLLHLDVLAPMLKTMKKFLGFHPQFKPGLLHIVDNNYYSKVDAITFTVEHDDGRGFNIKEADLILLGPSRTCKTPISMYIACNYGYRVANIPLVNDEFLKKQLYNRLRGVDRKRIIGLLMKPDVLINIRLERAGILADDELGQRSLDSYHDEEIVREELRFCRMLYAELSIESADVTKRAIEELSLEILEMAGVKTASY